MSHTIRILHLEDDPIDVKLVENTLAGVGIPCQIFPVQSRGEFEKALDQEEFDVVLADYVLPDFDGLSALRIGRKARPNLPFIFVSGTMGEDTAIEALTGGAWDFVPKTKLFRLAPAIERAIRDAENRKACERAEAANEKSRIELQAIYDHAPIMMSVVNGDGTIRFANKAFWGFIRESGEPQPGKPVGESLGCPHALEPANGCGHSPFCDACPLGTTLRKTLSSGTSFRSVEFPCHLLHNGVERTFMLLCSTALMKMAGGDALLLCLEDVSEQKAAEEERDRLRTEFLQAQKMEAYGRLAGGVAHDFNNLLTVIINGCELGLKYVPPENPGIGHLSTVLKTAHRAADLTRQLLAFSRKQEMQSKVIDLNDLIGELENMLHRLIGENIRLITSCSPGIPPILADPGQIGQVILNLVVNARDAMPDGGRLTISTDFRETGENSTFSGMVLGECSRQLAPGPFVWLSIADTGTGIPREVQDHLLEPFFTTKAPGKGTGLGLSTVFGIVKQSQGHMLLESQPGRGTTLHLIFPPSTPATLEPPKEAPSPRASSGGETILIAEDSENLRMVLVEILEELGYKTLATGDGENALRVATSHPGPIHLLLSDSIMPGMPGIQLWQKLQEKRPHIGVLFISGYPLGEIPGLQSHQQSLPFLQKPFSGAQLEKKVRETLDRLS